MRVVLAAFAALYAVLGRRAGKRPWSTRTHLAIAVVLLGGIVWMWAWQPRTVLYPTWTSEYPVKTKLGFYLGPTGSGVIVRERGRFYLHEDRPHRIVFASKNKLDRLKIAFGSESEDFEARIRFFDLPLTEGRTTRQIREFEFEPKASYPFRGMHIYEIGVDITRLSPRGERVEPYFFQIAPLK